MSPALRLLSATTNTSAFAVYSGSREDASPQPAAIPTMVARSKQHPVKPDEIPHGSDGHNSPSAALLAWLARVHPVPRRCRPYEIFAVS